MCPSVWNAVKNLMCEENKWRKSVSASQFICKTDKPELLRVVILSLKCCEKFVFVKDVDKKITNSAYVSEFIWKTRKEEQEKCILCSTCNAMKSLCWYSWENRVLSICICSSCVRLRKKNWEKFYLHLLQVLWKICVSEGWRWDNKCTFGCFMEERKWKQNERKITKEKVHFSFLCMYFIFLQCWKCADVVRTL